MMRPLHQPLVPPDEPQPGEFAEPKESPRRWQKTTNRNYWAKLDPRDFARFPAVKPLPYLEESRLFVRAQDGDIEARNILWRQHLRLAFSVVNRFHLPQSLLADAIQEAVIGLVAAIGRFDVHRYIAFSTYAWRCMEQKVWRFLGDHRYAVRLPENLHSEYHRFAKGLRLCRSGADWYDWREEWLSSNPKLFHHLSRFHRLAHPRPLDDAADLACNLPDPVRAIDEIPLKECVEEVLKTLTYREREIIKLRYGIGDGYAYTLEEVGRIFKFTRERVRQVEAIAMQRLRHPKRSRMLAGFMDGATRACKRNSLDTAVNPATITG